MTTADPDAAPAATVLQRMTAAGLSEERARQHLDGGAVRSDGEPITDPDRPLPWPTTWVLAPQ